MSVIRMNVLDQGYLILRDHMGTDLTPVNSARVSMKRRSLEFSPEDDKLLDYIVRNKHFSVFRHQMVQFEWNAPIMVARQIWRYTVGAAQQETLSAWNELSGRYVKEGFEWHVPKSNEWRGAPENMKQGSKGYLSINVGEELTKMLFETIDQAVENYEYAIDQGAAPEQARLFLPANGQYTQWILTASLQAIIHMLEERGDPHAMWETRQYASAVYKLTQPLFKRCIDKLVGNELAVRLEGGL